MSSSADNCNKREGLLDVTTSWIKMEKNFSHILPGEHIYKGRLFFGYSPPEVLDAVKSFEVREDDVFIVTYPKAGIYFLIEFSNCNE